MSASSTANPYARFLGSDDPVAVIAATPERLKELADNIGAGRISASSAPGKWSAREIFCHLADCEIAFGFRLRQTLAEEHHVVQPWDQEKWAAPYDTYSAEQALSTFHALRGWNLTLIRAALPTAGDKPVTHPERGAMTFLTLVETMAGHDRNHMIQLERLADAGA